MGITITATNSKLSFDMGCGGFSCLRRHIAEALDEEFGKNYAGIMACFTKQEYEENDHKAEEIINRKHLDDKYADVIDFLYAPDDSVGKVSYKTCRKIYELIKDVDFGNKCFRYAAHAHNDYEEFKGFLRECVSHRRNTRWY